MVDPGDVIKIGVHRFIDDAEVVAKSRQDKLPHRARVARLELAKYQRISHQSFPFRLATARLGTRTNILIGGGKRCQM